MSLMTSYFITIYDIIVIQLSNSHLNSVIQGSMMIRCNKVWKNSRKTMSDTKRHCCRQTTWRNLTSSAAWTECTNVTDGQTPDDSKDHAYA